MRKVRVVALVAVLATFVAGAFVSEAGAAAVKVPLFHPVPFRFGCFPITTGYQADTQSFAIFNKTPSGEVMVTIALKGAAPDRTYSANLAVAHFASGQGVCLAYESGSLTTNPAGNGTIRLKVDAPDANEAGVWLAPQFPTQGGPDYWGAGGVPVEAAS